MKNPLILLCLFSLISACGGTSTKSTLDPASPSVNADYGNSPRPSTTSPTGLLLIANLCIAEGGTQFDWTDANGEARNACLIKPATASDDIPLPLVVWLHPSLFPPDVILTTNILEQISTADLTGDPERPGFALLLPAGRDTEHFYPAPDDTGIGWDNWYRNLDRSSPDLNVDVAAIDHFIAEAKDSGGIDDQRVYLSGWSNGAAMAIMYSLNTPDIAAAAVYSAPNPYDDNTDPNPQIPFASELTPIYGLNNSCDVIGICYSSSKMHADLAARYPELVQQHVLVDDLQLNEVQACNALCASEDNLLSIGLVNHVRWPLAFTSDMFRFMRENPLK